MERIEQVAQFLTALRRPRGSALSRKNWIFRDKQVQFRPFLSVSHRIESLTISLDKGDRGKIRTNACLTATNGLRVSRCQCGVDVLELFRVVIRFATLF
jgi:hypothetical protein